MPVYVFSGTGAKRALANDINTKRVVGLVVDTIIPTLGSGSIQTDGTLTATTAEWDFLTGDVNGLAPNAPYFLDPITPGRLTRTAPSTLGYFICPIGTASNATDMIINLGPTIGI